MKKLFLLGLLLMSLTACKDEEVEPFVGDYLIFGHFYGYCLGEQCIEFYKLQGGALYEDQKDEYPYRQAYDGDYVQRSGADYQLAKDLYEQFPIKLLQESSNVIGAPDASDGGGIYLEFTVNGSKRFFLIDKFRNNVPEYLHPYLDRVEAKIAALQ